MPGLRGPALPRKGLISDAAKIVAVGKARFGWRDVSTLKEPGRLEGKKTLGYEIVRQMRWRVPEVIVYPTGGGTGLIGIWKAFDELEALGWIGSKRPRMIAVQAEGCSPDRPRLCEGRRGVGLFRRGTTSHRDCGFLNPWRSLILPKSVEAEAAAAVAVGDEASNARSSCSFKAKASSRSPEGAAAFAAVRKLVRAGEIREDEEVVVLNTATGLKYPDLLIRPPPPSSRPSTRSHRRSARTDDSGRRAI